MCLAWRLYRAMSGLLGRVYTRWKMEFWSQVVFLITLWYKLSRHVSWEREEKVILTSQCTFYSFPCEAPQQPENQILYYLRVELEPWRAVNRGPACQWRKPGIWAQVVLTRRKRSLNSWTGPKVSQNCLQSQPRFSIRSVVPITVAKRDYFY